jgi:hypothetical protein
VQQEMKTSLRDRGRVRADYHLPSKRGQSATEICFLSLLHHTRGPKTPRSPRPSLPDSTLIVDVSLFSLNSHLIGAFSSDICSSILYNLICSLWMTQSCGTSPNNQFGPSFGLTNPCHKINKSLTSTPSIYLAAVGFL